MGVKHFLANTAVLSGVVGFGCLIDVAIAVAVVGGLMVLGVNLGTAATVYLIGRLLWAGVDAVWSFAQDQEKKQLRRERLAAKKAEAKEVGTEGNTDQGS